MKKVDYKILLFFLMISGCIMLVIDTILVWPSIAMNYRSSKNLLSLKLKYKEENLEYFTQNQLSKKISSLEKNYTNSLKQINHPSNVLNTMTQIFKKNQLKATELAIKTKGSILQITLSGKYNNIITALYLITRNIHALKFKSILLSSDKNLTAKVTWEVYHF